MFEKYGWMCLIKENMNNQKKYIDHYTLILNTYVITTVYYMKN
jgi:hypothetical protein